MHPNVRPYILDEFKHIPKKKMCDCFLLVFGRESLEIDIANAKNIYESSDKTYMFRPWITLDPQQKRWAEIIMDSYEFTNFQQALNCCLLICKDHPQFNAATLAIYANEEVS